MTNQETIGAVRDGEFDDTFRDLYGDEPLPLHRDRWEKILIAHQERSEDGETRLFSSPGRTELAGNHTDHNHGRVLAASIQLDTIGAVTPTDDNIAEVVSEGYPPVCVDLDSLEKVPEESATTDALVRGIAASLVQRGGNAGGFRATTSSRVLKGSGLSSSAALEVLVGSIFNECHNEGRFDVVEIAKMGQEAENGYFGKPSGLMDQVACAHGGAVQIDFADPADPAVVPVNADFAAAGYDLTVLDTGGNHADLTPDYAAVPGEMRAVAAEVGVEVLRGTDEPAVLSAWQQIRENSGDRALLRSLHFFRENRRVEEMTEALDIGDMDSFLAGINASGRSSFEYLQNVYSPRHPEEQGVALALALVEEFLDGSGAYRVHGGGFAGTILVFVPSDRSVEFRDAMAPYFGVDSVTPLRIRSLPAGGIS